MLGTFKWMTCSSKTPTKSHVKHSVSFIKHQICNSLKIGAFSLHMVNQTALRLGKDSLGVHSIGVE